MADGFSDPERRAAWWSGDSRRAVSGGLLDVIREKRGEKEIDDLSDVEVVQMGLVMQPAIGKLFEEQTGIKVRDLDIAGTHATETWLRAHGDFETGDGGLLEVKNYHAAAINKYGEMDEELRLPDADYIQCLHEAVVFDKPHVWFAVLFGGQRFRYWKLEFTNEQKTEFVQRAAKWWAMAQTGTIPEPETVEQARYVWPRDNGDYVTATVRVEQLIARLKVCKQVIKELEDEERAATLQLQKFMQDKSEIRNMADETLVSWKATKPTRKFSADLFKKAQPSIYEQFMIDVPGNRRFLVK